MCVLTNAESFRAKFWKVVSLATLPVILIMSCCTYTRVQDEKKEPRDEFVDVPYMRRIVKPFPWGDGKHTLFHNPIKNPIAPHGYEAEDPHALTKKSN